MPKKILFISKDNLTTNPRLLKELKLAVNLGYDVDFIGFFSGNWSDGIDKELAKELKANFYYIPATRKPVFPWFISSLIEKIAQKIYPFFKKNLKINAYAHSKRSILIPRYLKQINEQYDLVVAHTLPSLFPSYLFAKKLNIPFVFDIEDFHPGERIGFDAQNERKRREFLMRKILPHAAYITYASPLIGKHSLDLLEGQKIPDSTLINNCFSQTEFQYQENNSEKVKFVWFSQNIAPARGLELVLPALGKYKDKIQLTLIGNLYNEFYQDFLVQYTDFIDIIDPLSQKELNQKLSEFDVGLAIELISADQNRDLCLTNKIFAYVQSGLYILATDTTAQKQFMDEHPNLGLVTNQNVQDMQEQIEKIIQNINLIRKEKKQRFEYAKKLAWENESNKLVDIWKQILNH